MSRPKFLQVKNLEKYQHYKFRFPPWIKLYREFLSDYTMRQLPLECRLFFVCSLIIGSEDGNCIPFDYDYLSQRVGFVVDESIVTPLLKAGLLLARSATATVSTPYSVSVSVVSSPSSPSSEGKESEKGEDGFEAFWQVYPRKIGKGAARKAWEKCGATNGLIERICTQVEAAKQTEQWQREGGRFIPLPATWLNQHRWEDDYSLSTPIAKPDGFRERMQKLAKGEAL